VPRTDHLKTSHAELNTAHSDYTLWEQIALNLTLLSFNYAVDYEKKLNHAEPTLFGLTTQFTVKANRAELPLFTLTIHLAMERNW
jgi:hypothetical protein